MLDPAFYSTLWICSCLCPGRLDSELVQISAGRWPAVVLTELAEISLRLLRDDFVSKPRQVWGLRPVGLRPEGVTPGLRQSSLTSSEDSPRKCIPESNLAWGAFGQSDKLSKTTKLILLDSLLQEVCIKSGSQPVHISLSSGLMRVHWNIWLPLHEIVS